jgi:hypothetical protein
MNLPWRHSEDLLGGDNAVSLVETGWLLEKLRAASKNQVSEGLEERIHARLQAGTQPGPAAVGRLVAFHRLRGWMPVGAVASLLCVFSGGLLVAHYSLLATQSGPSHIALSAPATGASDAALQHRVTVTVPHQGSSLAPANVRRTPASPVAVGRRKGRARPAPAATVTVR